MENAQLKIDTLLAQLKSAWTKYDHEVKEIDELFRKIEIEYPDRLKDVESSINRYLAFDGCLWWLIYFMVLASLIWLSGFLYGVLEFVILLIVFKVLINRWGTNLYQQRHDLKESIPNSNAKRRDKIKIAKDLSEEIKSLRGKILESVSSKNITQSIELKNILYKKPRLTFEATEIDKQIQKNADYYRWESSIVKEKNEVLNQFLNKLFGK